MNRSTIQLTTLLSRRDRAACLRVLADFGKGCPPTLETYDATRNAVKFATAARDIVGDLK